MAVLNCLYSPFHILAYQKGGDFNYQLQPYDYVASFLDQKQLSSISLNQQMYQKVEHLHSKAPI